MRKFKSMLFGLTIVTMLFLVSCSNDDGDTAPPLTDNSMIFDGVTYTILDAAIDDYGPQDPTGSGADTHYYHYMGFSDSEFIVVVEEGDGSTYYGGSDDATIVTYVQLYSPGVEAFQTGTFEYINPDTAAFADVDGNFFFGYGEVELDNDGVENGDLDGPEFDITGGTITVTPLDMGYDVTFDLETSAGNIRGSYSGGFQYLDNTE